MKYRYKNRVSKTNTTMTVVCSDGTVEFSTGVKRIDSILNSKEGYVDGSDNHNRANYELMEFRISVKEKYTNLFAEIGAPPTKEELKESVTGKSSEGSVTLRDALLRYKEMCDTKQVISNGKALKESTKADKSSKINGFIRNLSRETLDSIISRRYYRKKSGASFFQSIGEDIVSELLDKGYNSSTIFTLINTIKSILRWNLTRSNSENIDYVSKITFKKIQYDVEVLNSEDVKYIISNHREMRLSLSIRQQQVMDYLIAALFLAARVGDMKKWDSSNLYYKNGSQWLTYSQEKTGVVIDVPLNETVQKIFSRNLIISGQCLPTMKGDINICLRQILSKVPLFQEQSSRVVISGGKSKEVIKQRWEMISMHKMRATAITTMLEQGVPEHTVKSFSGHAVNSTAFARYVKARDDGKIEAKETYVKSIAI